MNYDNFIKLTKESNPSDVLSGIHLALWYAMKNNWDMAHNIVQDINTNTASLIGQHNKKIFEGLLGIGHNDLVDGFKDGTFWPKDYDITPYPYLKDMINDRIKKGIAVFHE